MGEEVEKRVLELVRQMVRAHRLRGTKGTIDQWRKLALLLGEREKGKL